MRKAIILLCMIGMAQANQLKKMYVHHAPTGPSLRETPQLELTKAVFYFTQQPEMHQLAHGDQEKNGWKHETYFFTVDGIDAGCKKSLPDMQKKTDYYQLVCTHVTDPRNGVRLEVCYDPQNIMCVRESFDAITADKGVVFRLINKKLLNDMQRVDKPLLQTACNKAHRVLIDCGHGGRDPGAIGINKIAEKDITMQMGHKLAHLLRKQGCEVFLTRDADLFVPLATRTHTINTYQPDAYISIHANSASHATVQGVETYCLSADLFSEFACADASGYLFQRVMQPRYTKNKKLAESVHTRILSNLSSYAVCDRKVRHSVPQVLLGTNTPGILVEVGYITHPEEAVRLAQAEYQDSLARGMCDGLMAYLKA